MGSGMLLTSSISNMVAPGVGCNLCYATTNRAARTIVWAVYGVLHRQVSDIELAPVKAA
jgi:hypothetical protein